MKKTTQFMLEISTVICLMEYVSNSDLDIMQTGMIVTTFRSGIFDCED
jgi:hypothetical protein